jgi:hypothetical protein
MMTRRIMKLLKLSLLVLQSALALVVGFTAVVLTNLAAGRVLHALLPGSLDPDGLPVTTLAQGLYLPILFLAGMAGAFLVVVGSPRKPVVHALVFGALALLGDIMVVRDYAAVWAIWFSVLVVVTVPPQVWLGAALGMRARRRWAPWAEADSEAVPAKASLTPDPALTRPIGEEP